ncbi:MULTISPECIES: hypothetical protein [unclassified Curtobacterium]|nr:MULTISPECIES: hypothetical protein [unclassified Curtobacterium]
MRRTARAVTRWDAEARDLGIGADERESLQTVFETPQLDWALAL